MVVSPATTPGTELSHPLGFLTKFGKVVVHLLNCLKDITFQKQEASSSIAQLFKCL